MPLLTSASSAPIGMQLATARSTAMTKQFLFPIACAAVAAGCAQLQPADKAGYASRMTAAGNRYVACVNAEVEKEIKMPVASEDIAVTAHGRCWSAWEAYRTATNASFLAGARTPQEIQYGRDKADAHLRQFERETREAVMERVARRSLRSARPSK